MQIHVKVTRPDTIHEGENGSRILWSVGSLILFFESRDEISEGLILLLYNGAQFLYSVPRPPDISEVLNELSSKLSEIMYASRSETGKPVGRPSG